ncbi:hypothetical protein ACX80U_09985 [Arthrobacter sp. TmT3-37]
MNETRAIPLVITLAITLVIALGRRARTAPHAVPAAAGVRNNDS